MALFLPLCPLLFPLVGRCVRHSEGLVSLCLPLYPFFGRVLFPFVSHCTSSCFPLLDGASAFPRVLSPFVSHCAPSCFPFLDGVSAFPRVWPSFNFLPLFPLVGWCVRLSEGLVSLCLPLRPFLFPFVGWCVRLSEGSCLPFSPVDSCLVRSPVRGSCLPLPAMAPLLVSLCWMVCPSPICLPLPSRCRVSPLSPNVSGCLHTCAPVLDGASTFLTSCLPLPPIVSACLPTRWIVCPPSQGLVSACLLLLSPHMRACVGWCIRLPEVSSPPLVSHCLPSCFPVLDGLSALPRFCLPCLPACLPTCLSSWFPVVGGLLLHLFKQCTVRGS